MPAGLAGAATSFLGSLHGITTVATTVPANGDLNPYGVAVVPSSVGRLYRGDVLVSNFNNSANQQVVGSLPTSNGQSTTAQAGCLIVLNAFGQVVRTISGGPIDGPWDLTATQFGHEGVLFVTNVLNGITPTDNPSNTVVDDGTVVRIDLNLAGHVPHVDSETVIATSFPERTDPSALVIGPTGVGLSHNDGSLYVADTLGNRIAAIPDPLFLRGPIFGSGFTVSKGGALDGPLGLAIAQNGDIITVNGNDGNAVETTPFGAQVSTVALDTTAMAPPALPGAGNLFGVAVAPGGNGLYFVDDGTNTLDQLG
jgi:hypothetical protein